MKNLQRVRSPYSFVSKFVASLTVVAMFGSIYSPVLAADIEPTVSKAVTQEYGNLPISFEQNTGQTDPAVKYLTRGKGYTAFLTDTEMVMSLSESSFRLQFVGGSEQAEVMGVDELPGKVNYLVGNDASKWQTGVQTFKKVNYDSVYPGIDLEFHGTQGLLEYDFIVKPFADPQNITLKVDGADKLEIAENGDLLITLNGEVVTMHSPKLFQLGAGVRQPVLGSFELGQDGEIKFSVGQYDRSRTLVIDPTVVYSTFLGGRVGSDLIYDTELDGDGNLYITGNTTSSDFPTTSGASDTTLATWDTFVTKLAPDGASVVYSTFYGGNDGWTRGGAIDIDASGSAYISGGTSSNSLPLVNPIVSQCGTGSCNPFFSNYIFVAKLSPDGSTLVYSTYLADAGWSRSIAVNAAGEAYISGMLSLNLTKIAADGGSVLSSLSLGTGYGEEILLDEDENVYLGGAAEGSLITQNAIQGTYGGGTYDAFVTKVANDGTTIIYSTFLGGSAEDRAYGIALDSERNVYVTGGTASTDFPTQNTLQPFTGNRDAFVTKINAAGDALVYSTYFGGDTEPYNEEGNDIQVNSIGEAFVVGTTSANANFPLADEFQSTIGGTRPYEYADAFLLQLSADGTSYPFSTYLGGVDFDGGANVEVDANNAAYFTGRVGSVAFPTTPGAFQTTGDGDGGVDGFAMKVQFPPLPLVVESDGPYTVDEGQSVLVSLTASGGVAPYTYDWDFDNNGSYETPGQTASFSALSLDPGVYTIGYRVTDDVFATDTNTTTVTVNDVLTIDDFVMFGNDGVYLQDTAIVNSGNVGSNIASTAPYLDNTTNSETVIGKETTFLDSSSKVFGDTVRMKLNATAFDVYYNTYSQASGVTVGNHVTPLTLPVLSTLPTVPSFTAGTTNITVPISGSQILAAGSYGNLIVRNSGTLTLTGGVYNFNNWDLKQLANVHFAAPSEIRIVERIKTDGSVSIIPAPSSSVTADQVKIYVTGINGTTGALSATPKSVRIASDSNIGASIYAPNGTLLIQQDGYLEGSFLGKWVSIGDRGDLTLNSAF